MATDHESMTLPPARPRKSSTSQTSRTERSAARCCVFQRHKLEDAKLVQAQSQHENTQACNSVNFQYSAESPADIVSTSTNTTKQTVPRVYKRNTVLYLHYLQRKMKVIPSKIDSYRYGLENDLKLLNSKIYSYVHNLDRKIQLLNANKDSYVDVVKEIQWLQVEQESHAHDVHKNLKGLNNSHEQILTQIEPLNAITNSSNPFFTTQIEKLKYSDRKIKMQALHKEHHDVCLQGCNEFLDTTNSLTADLEKQIKLLNAKKDSHAEYLARQIQLLSARKNVYASNLVRQIQRMIARRSSYAIDLGKRYVILLDKQDSYDYDIRREYELMHSKLAPFAHDLDSQLKMLHLKIVSWGEGFIKLKIQLNSYMKSYFLDIKQKMKLLESDMAPYLGREIWLRR